MTGAEAIAYIHSMTWDRRATGYEHAENLLQAMGNPEKGLRFIHIGGTNGKGSTAAMLASVLQQAGYKTGLYTSPYIFRFHERMQINGQPISDEQLAEITEYVKAYAERLPICPSEFALVCCIAFEYFAREKCDIVVLEVGMGGANDSTNVIDCPEVAVMTNIGLDHTEYLGNTLEEIAKTKAGILKPGGQAVIYPCEPSVERVFRQHCDKNSIEMHVVDVDGLACVSHSLEGQVFDYRERKGIHLSLLGEHQMKNAAVVMQVIDVLKEKGWKIDETHLRDGLKNARWPGRFELIGREPDFIIDGGHNPQCIEALAKNVQTYLEKRRIIALTGVLADKDYAKMYQPILSYIETFVCITPNSERKLEGEDLARYLNTTGVNAIACSTVYEGIKRAEDLAGEDGVVLFFGSLYLIGEIQHTFEMMHLH